MNLNRLTQIVIAVSLGVSGSMTTHANDNAEQHTHGEFFANFRLGAITSEDEAGDRTEGSAWGGKLGFMTKRWQGISFGATAYTTQKLFNDDNGDFFGSDGDGYSILGEAFIQAKFANTEIKAGRFEFDSPHADTDDIRMVPNTFSGFVLTNNDIKDTTLYVAHLDKWAGVDAQQPEKFNHLTGKDGLTTIGAEFEGVENLGLQAWYYHIPDYANLMYFEAAYELDNLTFGAQFGSQQDKTSDNSGPDGEVLGLTASYALNDFTLTGAMNKVSGTVANGFGGGPFFTSADDHTIDGTPDQSALAFGLEYTGIEKLTLGLLNVNFDKGEDELDLYANYEVTDNVNLEFVYTHMYDDGKIFRMMFNAEF